MTKKENNTIEKIIRKYIYLVDTLYFEHYKNIFINKFKKGISDGYTQNLPEYKIVETIVNEINKVNDIVNGINLVTFSNGFSISTNGIFIHGPKSEVEFEYYGSKTKRELGDLIFIISVVYNNKKYFEKLTICQCKKSKKEPKWSFDKNSKEQLYLLARFPTFKKIRGIIPNGLYNLPNYSHCLGSYGFLYPNDFVFASAKIVEIFVKNKNNVSKEDIKNIKQRFIPNLLFYVSKEYRWKKYNKGFPKPSTPVIDNIIHSYNLENFTNHYLKSLIGELAFACGVFYNKEVSQFLTKLMEKIKEKAHKDKRYEKFIKSFYKYKYCNNGVIKDSNNGNKKGEKNFEKFDNDPMGGIGIIHTIINLGEE